jgi:uncharacterized protein (TIGR02145 family)
MSKKLIPIALFVFISSGLYSQRPALNLTFTAVDNAAYVQLDSIKVMNRTQGGDTVMYWPDTVLSFYYVGIAEPEQKISDFQVFQNYPNPVADQTTISMFIPEKDNVSMIVTDILGRVILKTDRVLEKGIHSFLFTPGGRNLYFFTAQWRGMSSSIKILHTVFNSNGISSLEYTGSKASFQQLKVTEDIQDFDFSMGDELLYIGYGNGLQSGMLDAPVEDQTYTFQFATNIPCPGTPTVEYEGQVYNTIQIFSQCWLKENLNVGMMVPGDQEQSDNGTIEKYCYNNEPDSCAKYGGLYQWDEMMQYATQQGVQGICPPGWHLATDEEWKVMEGAVDNQYGIGDPEWDINWAFRGYDAGTNLKNASGWYSGGNGTDLFGFSGLPGGGHEYDNSFLGVGNYSLWFTSTEGVYDAWSRVLIFDYTQVGRSDDYEYFEEIGESVRCLRNEDYYMPAGFVAYWNFNDTPEEQISGAAPSAVIDLTYEDSYKPDAGKAAKFNGTSTIIEFPDGDLWMNTGDFTLSFWVKAQSEGHVNENGDPKGHFVMGLGAFYGFQFEITADYSWCKLAASYELADGLTATEDIWFSGDGNINWQGWTYCRDLSDSGGVAALLIDTWANVACVYNSTTREGVMYINGLIMKAQDFDLWPDGDPKRGVVGLKYGGMAPDVVNELAFGFIQSRAGTLWDTESWGGYDFPTSNHFGGWLDDVRVFHEALTAEEVYMMYQSEKP